MKRLVITGLALGLAACSSVHGSDEHDSPRVDQPAGFVSLDDDEYYVLNSGGLTLYKEGGHASLRYWYLRNSEGVDPGDVITIVNPDDACNESYPDQCSGESADIVADGESILGVRLSDDELDNGFMGLTYYDAPLIVDAPIDIEHEPGATLPETIMADDLEDNIPDGGAIVMVSAENEESVVATLNEAGVRPLIVVEQGADEAG